MTHRYLQISTGLETSENRAHEHQHNQFHKDAFEPRSRDEFKAIVTRQPFRVKESDPHRFTNHPPQKATTTTTQAHSKRKHNKSKKRKLTKNKTDIKNRPRDLPPKSNKTTTNQPTRRRQERRTRRWNQTPSLQKPPTLFTIAPSLAYSDETRLEQPRRRLRRTKAAASNPKLESDGDFTVKAEHTTTGVRSTSWMMKFGLKREKGTAVDGRKVGLERC